jgi:phosphoenolpyruvate-protein phosphotransferase (PTS system enzyme I)
MTKNLVVKGLSLSKGVAIGKPFFPHLSDEGVPAYRIEQEQVEKEIKRYRSALFSSQREIKKLQTKLDSEGLAEIVTILEAHLEMLQDPFLTTEIEEKIRNLRKNSEAVFLDSIDAFKGSFVGNNSFIKERIQDVTDISRRVLSHLMNKNSRAFIPPSSILFFEELVPSVIAEVSTKFMTGFISRTGGISSHSAIIARARGIPYVGGIAVEELIQESIEDVIVDGTGGVVIINPDQKALIEYSKKINTISQEETFSAEPITQEGHKITVLANVEHVKDVEALSSVQAEGIGLFRSEYLFSGGEFPSEEQQFATYKEIVSKMDQHPVIIRIFDVGADKMNFLPKDFLKEKENNPVLGCRAIRLMLQHMDLFKKQLRALLRASVYGNLHILLPMISDPGEIVEVKKILSDLEKELISEGIDVNPSIPLGCMVEVPSIALMADVLVEECDFLSIGTNDLTQYLLAVDRTNPYVNEFYAKAHPSLFRLIEYVIEQVKQAGKRLIVCGEIASDPIFIPLLMGMGVETFSIAFRQIPAVRKLISESSFKACEIYKERAMSCKTAEELTAFLQKKATLPE